MKSYLGTLLILVLLITLAAGRLGRIKRGAYCKQKGRFSSNSGGDSNDGQSSRGGVESNTSGINAAGRGQGSGFGSGSGSEFGSGSGSGFGSGSGTGVGTGA